MSLKEKLVYISKSKKGTYDACPLSFKFRYVDKLPEAENPAFKIGTDVHNFIDKFYDIVQIQDNEISGISSLTYHPNTNYKKNFVKFELERWGIIKSGGYDRNYFFPVVKEKSYTAETPQLTGIVDRVHRCCPTDPFAPRHEEFEIGDLVIVENKTGKPTAEKCVKYENDMLWYKMLIEIVKPDLAPIKWGAVYFPFDNYVYHTKLKTENCRKLAKEIKAVRESIIFSIDNNHWPSKPSLFSCNWCLFKNQCTEVYKNE